MPGAGNSFSSIGADGLRLTGDSSTISSHGSILAVGDSFTYGDEVFDEEAWPAQLQRLTGRRVLNGGVTGYGLDQVVLRTEQLVVEHSPSSIVVGFIADDILRTEMRQMWWRDKPWFAIENDQLVLKGVPVPDRRKLPLHIRQRLEGFLVDGPPILQRLFGFRSRVHPAGHGLTIAKRLVERLAQLGTERRLKIVLMAQYPPQTWIDAEFAREQRRLTKSLLEHADICGIATLDTFQRIAAEPKPLRYYATTHMNARGNSMIASLLAATQSSLAGGRGIARTVHHLFARCSAGGPPFSGDIGRRADAVLHLAGGESGWALTGPYFTLQPRDYTARISFAPGAARIGRVIMQVTVRAGETTMATREFDLASTDEPWLSLDFGLATAEPDCEIRLWCYPGVNAVFTTVEIMQREVVFEESARSLSTSQSEVP
jgi:lysophospholipase L1-like esterase